MPASTLEAISDDAGRLAVLAIDQRATLRRMLTEVGAPASDDDLKQVKVDVVGALSPWSTGVLMDTDYGVGPVRRAGALADGVGLLIATEPAVKHKHRGEHLTARTPGQDAPWVRSQGGDALKFLLQWNPDREVVQGDRDLAAIAVDVVGSVVADCAAHGLPSVIEPLVSFGPDRSATQEQHEAAVVRSAVRLAPLGMDLLKLEWPGSAAACAEVTQGLGDVPWALLSAGVDYAAFLERVRLAVENGAAGFIAGRAVWGEVVRYTGPDRRAWIADVAVPRMQGLLDLVREYEGRRQAVA